MIWIPEICIDLDPCSHVASPIKNQPEQLHCGKTFISQQTLPSWSLSQLSNKKGACGTYFPLPLFTNCLTKHNSDAWKDLITYNFLLHHAIPDSHITYMRSQLSTKTGDIRSTFPSFLAYSYCLCSCLSTNLTFIVYPATPILLHT